MARGEGELLQILVGAANLAVDELAFGDVAGDLGGTHDPALQVLDGRDGQRDVQQRAVLPHADGLEMVDAFTGADARDDLDLFRAPVLRNEHRDRLAQRFGFGVAEQSLGAGIPTGNDAVQVFTDDGVIRRINDRTQQQGRAVLDRVRRQGHTHTGILAQPDPSIPGEFGTPEARSPGCSGRFRRAAGRSSRRAPSSRTGSPC